MHRRLTITTLLVAALAAAAFITTGSASPTKTLRFLETQQSFTLDPQGPPSVGSRLILTKAIYNRVSQFGKPSGARVGSLEVICTVVSEARAQCSVTGHVPDGEIVAMGAMRLTRNGVGANTFAIVGGAGAYSGARGTVSSRDVDETRSLTTLHITG